MIPRYVPYYYSRNPTVVTNPSTRAVPLSLSSTNIPEYRRLLESNGYSVSNPGVEVPSLPYVINNIGYSTQTGEIVNSNPYLNLTPIESMTYETSRPTITLDYSDYTLCISENASVYYICLVTTYTQGTSRFSNRCFLSDGTAFYYTPITSGDSNIYSVYLALVNDTHVVYNINTLNTALTPSVQNNTQTTSCILSKAEYNLEPFLSEFRT